MEIILVDAANSTDIRFLEAFEKQEKTKDLKMYNSLSSNF